MHSIVEKASIIVGLSFVNLFIVSSSVLSFANLNWLIELNSEFFILFKISNNVIESGPPQNDSLPNYNFLKTSL